MNQHHENHYILGTKTLDYDSNIIEAASIEDFLIPMNDILKKEVKTGFEKLKSLKKVDGMITEMTRLISIAELLQSHFEFTLSVLQTQTQEEVQTLMEKFSLIRKYYEQVKSKDDLQIVPAKYVLLIFHDKLVYEFIKLMKQCFKVGWRKQIKLVRNTENLSRIKILSNRFEIAAEHYGPVITFPKDDLFCLPKNTPVWKDLLKSAVIKQILTKEEAYQSFKEFEFTNNMGHVIIQNKNDYKSVLSLKRAFNLLKDLAYYGTHAKQAETHALLRLANLKYEEAFDLWNLPEQPFFSAVLTLGYPIVDYDEHIYVPRLFPAITKELIMKEYEEGTINKLQAHEAKSLKAPELVGTKEEIIEELFVNSERKIPIRIISDESLEFKESIQSILKGVVRKATRVITGSEICQPEEPKSDTENTIVVHIHGGGFVAMSSASHRVYLNRWVKNTKVTHFSIDYRIAPQDPYPAGLDDIWQGYLWIVNYAETILGIKNKKIIIVGDSAGGNLALALSLRLIRAGLEPPHACLLFYPALLVDDNTSSPSTFASLDDTMVSPTLLKLCVKAYVGKEFKNLEDPFISPLAGSNELLEKLPAIRIVVGTKDPFHDDSWRLLAKLKKLNKKVKLIVHEHIRHGFLNHPGLKNYHLYMEEACDLIRELAADNHSY